MPIKRSQSAPQPVAAVFCPTKADVNDTGARAALARSKSYLVQPSAANSPLVEREDPFSLSGFFPASHRTAPEDEQWKWLRTEEEAEDDKVSVSSFSVDDDDSVLGELEDKLAGETIKGEDKLGVLSLVTMFSRTDPDTEDRLFSPYIEDEAVDHESLYLSLCARRRANSRLHSSQATESSLQMENLFFPATDDTPEVDGGDNNWSRSILGGMRLIS